MNPEQQGLIEDIVSRFIQAAPSDNWKELQVDVSMLQNISGFVATAIAEDDSETQFFIDDATDKKILHALGRLREDMAADGSGRGAWYIMNLRIPRVGQGRPAVDFDFETKPEFGVHVGDAAYKQDLAHFPRTPEHVPEWLGGPSKEKPADKPVPESATAPAAATIAATTSAGPTDETPTDTDTDTDTDQPVWQRATDPDDPDESDPFSESEVVTDASDDTAQEIPLNPTDQPAAPAATIVLNENGEEVDTIPADPPTDDALAVELPEQDASDQVPAEESTEIEPEVDTEPNPQPLPGQSVQPTTPPPAPVDDTPWWDNDDTTTPDAPKSA